MTKEEHRLQMKWDKFVKGMEHIIAMDCFMCISPYWKVSLLKRDSHDYMYNKDVLINPLSTISKPEDVMEKMYHDGDYICGYEHDLFSKDPKAFVMEIITPDWCDTRNVDGRGELLDISNEWRRHNFNAPKVTGIVDYMRWRLCEDSRNIEYMGLLSADCFNVDILEKWELGQDTTDIIYNLYLENMLRRSD